MIAMRRTSPMLFTRSVDNAITVGLRKSGIMLQKELRRALTTGNRSGRVYRYRGQSYQASAAGEIPAKRSGDLAKSVDFGVSGKRLTFGERMFYAKFLQNGTSRMAARPHVDVIVNRYLPDVARELHNEIKKVF